MPPSTFTNGPTLDAELEQVWKAYEKELKVLGDEIKAWAPKRASTTKKLDMDKMAGCLVLIRRCIPPPRAAVASGLFDRRQTFYDWVKRAKEPGAYGPDKLFLNLIDRASAEGFALGYGKLWDSGETGPIRWMMANRYPDECGPAALVSQELRQPELKDSPAYVQLLQALLPKLAKLPGGLEVAAEVFGVAMPPPAPPATEGG